MRQLKLIDLRCLVDTFRLSTLNDLIRVFRQRRRIDLAFATRDAGTDYLTVF